MDPHGARQVARPRNQVIEEPTGGNSDYGSEQTVANEAVSLGLSRRQVVPVAMAMYGVMTAKP